MHRGLERDPALRPSTARDFIAALAPFSGGSDRVQESELVALSAAARKARPVRVEISASAVNGIKNLARGGRGGSSLPPAGPKTPLDGPETPRAAPRPRSVAPLRSVVPAPTPAPTSRGKLALIALLFVTVGLIAAALSYTLTKR